MADVVATVSVVITSHDRHGPLLEAVASVQDQTHPSVEIIVVDDGSAPPVPHLGPHVTVLRHGHAHGVCAARNTGLAAASGEYVMFLDDDDTLPPDAVSRSLTAAESSTLPPPVAVLGAISVVDEAGQELTRRLPPTFARGSGWLFDPRPPGRTLTVQNTLLAPRRVVIDIGGWDEELRAWVHDDFFLRLTRVCSIQGCDDVTYRLLQPRAGGGNVSRSLEARAASMRRTLELHSSQFARHPRRRAKYLGTLAMTYLRAGDGRGARRFAFASVRAAPARQKAVPQLLLALAGPSVYRAIQPLRDRTRTRRHRHRGRVRPT